MEALIVGDSHGNSKFMTTIFEIGYENGYPGIFHVGDFGWWPTMNNQGKKLPNHFVILIQKLCIKYNMFCWVIDGNHDYPGETPADLNGYLPWQIDKKYLEADKDDEFWYNHFGLKWIPRGSHTIINNKKVGFIGGAVSVDRIIQELSHTWFKEEMLTADDVEHIKQMGEIDILFSHDRIGIPPGFRKLSFGETTDMYIARQQSRMKNIFSVLNPKIHFHGHFHYRYESENEEWPGCKTYGLAHESKNAFVGFNFETLEVTYPS